MPNTKRQRLHQVFYKGNGNNHNDTAINNCRCPDAPQPEVTPHGLLQFLHSVKHEQRERDDVDAFTDLGKHLDSVVCASYSSEVEMEMAR
eukprot:5481471-Heterocapsa_arctica.AAC.1